MTVLPRVGSTHRPHTETRAKNGVHRKARARLFDHDEAFARWMAGASAAELARAYGVHRTSIDNVIKKRRDAARSPIPCPAPATPPPGRVDGGDASTGGLRGAPATTNGHPGAYDGVGTGDNGVGSTTQAGAPIVRRQTDEHGDCLFVLEIPAAKYVTHSRSLVDELLQPWDAGVVRWINEED